VTCPHCQQRVTSLVLETGPVLIRHQREWNEDGKRMRCRQQWVAVPHRANRTVTLITVADREAADRVLRREADRWLVERTRDLLTLLRVPA
jgi:hypothetical protein